MLKENIKTEQNEDSSDTDPAMMAMAMIDFLPKLQDFKNHTVLQENDEKVVNKLVEFIKSIPLNKYGVGIRTNDQASAVKIYYEKVFIPIQKVVANQPSTNSYCIDINYYFYL